MGDGGGDRVSRGDPLHRATQAGEGRGGIDRAGRPPDDRARPPPRSTPGRHAVAKGMARCAWDWSGVRRIGARPASAAGRDSSPSSNTACSLLLSPNVSHHIRAGARSGCEGRRWKRAAAVSPGQSATNRRGGRHRGEGSSCGSRGSSTNGPGSGRSGKASPGGAGDGTGVHSGADTRAEEATPESGHPPTYHRSPLGNDIRAQPFLFWFR